MANVLRGKDLGIQCCLTCEKANHINQVNCSRCGSIIHTRIYNSYARTSLLLFLSLILYIPANTIPMFVFNKLGTSTNNTIFEGITILYQNGMIFLAAIVFIASIVIPIFKISCLTLLLIFVHSSTRSITKKKTILYRFIKNIGRWSMLDIFVISVMLTLVNVAPFISVTISWGTSAFGAVVITTMLASEAFDSRILWDVFEENYTLTENNTHE